MYESPHKYAMRTYFVIFAAMAEGGKVNVDDDNSTGKKKSEHESLCKIVHIT